MILPTEQGRLRSQMCQMTKGTTRGQTHAVVANVARLFHVEPVDVFLEQAEQWEVEGGQSGLLALECFTFHSVLKWHPRSTTKLPIHLLKGSHSLWPHNGRRTCALSSALWAPGRQCGGLPGTPGGRRPPPSSEAPPGSGCGRSRRLGSSPAEGLQEEGGRQEFRVGNIESTVRIKCIPGNTTLDLGTAFCRGIKKQCVCTHRNYIFMYVYTCNYMHYEGWWAEELLLCVFKL